jgi:hypothetical protein
MDPNLTQQVLQRLAELPADVRQAVQGADIGKKIGALGVTYGLHIDQIGALEDETMMVMLGFLSPDGFEQHIATTLRLAPDISAQIAKDINSNIFLAVRASLREFTAKQHTTSSTAPAPVTTLHPADTILSQKTVTIAPGADLKPPAYKADPYREPVE